ncbi:MAG: Spy/CpxP family protein refolding chaperone [Rhodospirillales bacterium]
MRGMFVRYAAAAVLAAGLMLGQTQPPAEGQPGQRMAKRLDQVAIVLDLTPDQRTQLQTIIQQAMQESKPIFQQLRQNRLQMRELMESGATGPQFEQQVQQLAQAQGQLFGQLASIKARGVAKFYSTLTPQQRQKAEALFGLMMHHHFPRFGGGY